MSQTAAPPTAEQRHRLEISPEVQYKYKSRADESGLLKDLGNVFLLWTLETAENL